MTTDTFVIDTTKSPVKPTILKDPNASLDYTWNWTDYLALISSDTIQSYQILPADAAITVQSSSSNGQKVIAWLAGGAEGSIYRVICRIVTTGGRTDDRSIFLKVKER